MSIRFVTLAASAALGAAVPAFAIAAQTTARPAAQAPRPAAPAAANRQAPPTRAAMQQTLNNNFRAIDTNGDGSLNSVEMAAAQSKTQQQRIGAARTRFEAQFTRLDTNKDGTLSKVEFMAGAPPATAGQVNGAALVTQLDKNKDGKVSADEFRAPMLASFDRADTNKDGTISQAERQAAGQRRN